jgi:hypothetical protein
MADAFARNEASEENIPMVSISKHVDINEIEKRAAQVRSHWSVAERLRRTGLPPDALPRLRDFFLSARGSQWRSTSPFQPAKKPGR